MYSLVGVISNKSKKDKEFLGFSKSMVIQCIMLFVFICSGLLVHRYILLFAALFTVVVALIGSVDSLYYHLLFSISFTAIYKLSPSSSSLIAYVIILTALILIFRIRYFSQNHLVLILFYALYVLLGMGNNYTTVIKMIMTMFLLYFFIDTVQPYNFKNHIMAFSLGVISSSVVGSFKNSIPQLKSFITSEFTIMGENSLTTRFTGLNADPNFFSVSAIFAIVLCMMLYLNKCGNRIFLGLIIVVQTVFGFISYSKMFLMVLFFVAVILVLSGMSSPKKIVVTFISAFAVGGGILHWMQKNGYLSYMEKRLFEGDISTGRFEIWKDYLDYIGNSIKTLILGDGLGVAYLSTGGPHNTYIEAIYFVGLVGSVLFLYFIILSFNHKRYAIKRNIINYLPLIVFLAINGALGCFTINELMFYCMLIWIGLNIDMKLSLSSQADSLKNGGDLNV